MNDKKKEEIPQKNDDTASALETQYEQSSDLFNIMNKATKTTQTTNAKGFKSNKLIVPKTVVPKSNADFARKDKTVCNEEELATLQTKTKSGGTKELNLNKPYLKSVTDLKDIKKSEKPKKK